jgi:branched-chain amino acid transport system substrate-binding protein
VSKTTGRSAVVATAGILVLAIALSACSSSSSSSGGTPTSTVDGAGVLGADDAAKGTPVKLGFIYPGKSTGADATVQLTAAQAVVKYANAKLGGANGHPITLDACPDNNDPTQAQDCANGFIKHGDIAVAAGQEGEVAQVIKPLIAASVPYFDISNTSNELFASKTGFVILNPFIALAAGAVQAKLKGIKNVALIVIDVPAATGPFKEDTPPLYAGSGATVQIITVPIGTADMTPQIASAETKKPGIYELIGNGPFCAAALKAIKTLGSKAEIIGIDACLDKTSAAAVPGGFSGMKVLAQADLDPTSAEVKLYDAVRTTYAPGTPTSNFFSSGYQGVLGLIRALNAGKLAANTPAAALAAIRTGKDVLIPLGGGKTFACDGKAIPSKSAGICSTVGFLSDATADGGQRNFSTFDDPAIYAAAKQ